MVPALIAVIIALIAGLAVVSVRMALNPAEAAPEVDCSVAARDDADEARTVADACGIDVEIQGERTPWETSWATAGGNSRLLVSAVPTSTNVNGTWEDIDPTIDSEPEGDGMMHALAPVFSVSFNPGGSAGEDLPLAQIEREGKTLKLWFPLPLSVPEVEGTVATYGLFEGATLTVYVNESGTGFAPILTLASASAAEEFRSRLAQARDAADLPGTGWDLPFRLELSEGLSVEMRPHGAFEIVDADGLVSFSAPPSLMWDAAAGEPVPGQPAAATPPVGDVAPPIARGPEPWPGDAVVQMPVRVEDDSLIITPSADFLADPDTVWPVRIDPVIEGQGAAEWIMLRTGGFTSSVWKFSDISPGYTGGGMGRCNESSCNATYTARLVWEFSGMTKLKAATSADVISAQFRVKGLHSYSCTPQRANLHLTSGISSSSTWSSVTWKDQVSYRTDAHRESCNNVRTVEYDATAAAEDFADSSTSYLALGLKANSETTMAGWKRFHKSAVLDVEYNRAPNAPTVTNLLSPEKACATGSSAPYINTLTPTLRAKGSDPDGDDVGIAFIVVKTGVESTVFSTSATTPKGAGEVHTKKVEAGKLEDNTRYRYRAKTWDKKRYSGWGVPCEFITLVGAPPTPTITAVSGAAAVYSTNVETGGVGVKGRFQIAIANPDRVQQIKITSEGQTSTGTITVSGSGPWTVDLEPTRAGAQTIKAQAFSKTGSSGPIATYTFDVAGAREGAIWMLDEGTGTAAADTADTGFARDLSISGATWTSGPHALFGSRTGDKALLFDGVNDAATTPSPPLTTTHAFALSAFVWLNGGTTSQGKSYTALSQDGVKESGFELGYRDACLTSPTRGCWAFSLPASDSATASELVVKSEVPVTTGQWVHIVADRNSTGSQVRLWVCPVGSPTAPTAAIPTRTSVSTSNPRWKAEGSFVLGRGKDNGAATRWWPGRIDNVRLFPGQVVSEAKVRRMCSGAEASDFGGDPRLLDPTIEDGRE